MEYFPSMGLATIWIIIIPILAVWSIVWKGIALWRAGSNRQMAWFIVILLINTVGILEIIYIFAFSRRRGAS